ncbi:AraC family transcriptional regulator [Arcticibacter pallidicorallinus]|uniref:AraC family transcriptional regulator n=1 Tax=Arcticibacter pallidicorallinus TaxID=1259464 RepID=A0A2T0UCN6_9SPHI|nr:AraC family transcriptional regulator [Arcticibacter pallidicorallinus]PRY55577.1 AraC family transcriptional regulator [Arcticibacter pallidicorallinus]
MKPLFHKVPTKLQSSFSIRHDIKPRFDTIWHYHPELELHLTVRGEGVRFIGDNISNFSSGELVLLGENLPHTFRCKDEYFAANSTLEVEAIVIHFLPDCLGKDILNLPEAYLIPKLLEKAKRGMIINGEAKEKLSALMFSAIDASGLDKIIILLSILKILAETEDYKTIVTGQHTVNKSTESDTIRLNKVYNYTLTHYKKEISLEEISEISNLSVTSFCRYFKLMTKKTYYDFLIEIRISHACRALIDDKLPTEVICFDCGFNNVSNFYRHFKKVTGLTPLDYKRQYLQKI